MDGPTMKEMLDEDVCVLGEEILKDLTLLIRLIEAVLSNWTWDSGQANRGYTGEIEFVKSTSNLGLESVSDSNNVVTFPFVNPESVSNTSPINETMEDSAYILSLNVFISQLMDNIIANNNEPTPLNEEKQVNPLEEEIDLINIGTNDEPKIVQIGKSLTKLEKQELVALLHEFKEVFAWSYQDMPGIAADFFQHNIPTDPTFKPVKQKL